MENIDKHVDKAIGLAKDATVAMKDVQSKMVEGSAALKAKVAKHRNWFTNTATFKSACESVFNSVDLDATGSVDAKVRGSGRGSVVASTVARRVVHVVRSRVIPRGASLTHAPPTPPPLSVRGVPPPSPQELYAAVLLLYLKLAKVIRGLTPPTASDVKRLMSEVGRLARRASRVARRSSSAALMRTMRGLGTRVTRETPRRTSDPFLPPTDHARARRSRRRVGAGWLRRWRPSSWRTRRIAHSSTTSQGTARMV